MVNVGLVGIGFMGMIHYLAYQQVRGARVSAVVSRERASWPAIGAASREISVRPARRWICAAWPGIPIGGNCSTIRRSTWLISACRRRCMPKSRSRPLEAGKHVLCEKPIALSPPTRRGWSVPAEKARQQLLIGHVLPFMPEYAFATKRSAAANMASCWAGNFKRVISDPLWIKDFYDPRKVGGPVVDLHIHDAHFIRLVCGMPSAVFSTGRMRGESVEFIDTQFLYPGKRLAVSATSGVINQQGAALRMPSRFISNGPRYCSTRRFSPAGHDLDAADLAHQRRPVAAAEIEKR